MTLKPETHRHLSRESRRFSEVCQPSWQILWMDALHPPGAQIARPLYPGKALPLSIDVHELAVGVGDPKQHRQTLDHRKRQLAQVSLDREVLSLAQHSGTTLWGASMRRPR